MKSTSLNFPVLFISLLLTTACDPTDSSQTPWVKSDLLFEYSGTDDWTSKWMLDGQRARIINSEKGMELIAGPEAKNDTCHTVLWTKQSFSGDICIAYDYTRTDTTSRFVNIIYFLATGEGTEEYPTDIAQWNEKRVIPHMRTYFHHMNTYHISYAALSDGGTSDYIRLRRYDPQKRRLKGTDIPEDYFNTGLFQPNVTYHIQICKYQNQIEMHIQHKENEADQLTCTWDISDTPTCLSGRIGLRHMYTRSARYKDFKVWSLQSTADH